MRRALTAVGLVLTAALLSMPAVALAAAVQAGRPIPAGVSYPEAIGCARGGACEVIGQTSGGAPAVVRVAGGTAGQAIAVPGVPGSSELDLDGVSCASASHCVAVGSGEDSDTVPISHGVPGRIIRDRSPSIQLVSGLICPNGRCGVGRRESGRCRLSVGRPFCTRALLHHR